MLISIAIPTYNNQETILNAINSCLNQKTKLEYEVLVINNASTDQTEAKLKTLNDSRLRILNNKETITMYENHNVCLMEAKGDYIIFCHADDLLQDSALANIEKKLNERSYPSKYVLFGHSMFRDYYNALLNTPFSINEVIVGENAFLLFLGGGLTPSGTCYSRKSLLESGGFEKVEHKIAMSDWVSMIRIAQEGFMFEMKDDMFFIRKKSSTLVDINADIVYEAADAAFANYLKRTDENVLRDMFYKSLSLKNKPWLFYYVLAKRNISRKVLFKLLLKEFLNKPNLFLRTKLFRIILQRLTNS